MFRQQAREAFLSKLASILGTDRAKLESAFKEAAKETAEEAYRSGYLTKEQFERISARIEQGRPSIFGLRWTFLARMHRKVGVIFDAVARKLGMPVDELEKRLASGERLTDIAHEKGVSGEALKQTVVAALKPELDRLVQEGTIAPKLAEAILHRVEESELPARAA